MKTGRKIFYGWIVVFSSSLLLALGLGMFVSTNSVFVKPICDSFGFARGEFTLYRTIVTLVGAVTMPFYGRLIQKIGAKKVLLIGAVTLSAVMFCYSFASQLWHFYLLAAINGLFFNGVSFMSVGVLVSAWFDGKKGIATGLAYAGSGLGGAIMVPVISGIIEQFGWQWAYRFMGIAGAIILIPVVIFIIKNKPSDMGLEPMPKDKASRQAVSLTGRNITMKEAFHTGTFWVLVVVFFLINSFAGATNTHSASYFSDLGYDTAFVSAVISLFMVFLTVGKIIMGFAYDKLGTLAGNMVICVSAIAFPIFALLAANPAMPWAYAVTVGLASSGVSVPVTILAIRYFGSKDFPAIFSFFSMVSALAPSVSVPAMGTVYDVTGSYRPAWFFFLACSVIIAVCLIGVELSYRKKLAAGKYAINNNGEVSYDT